MIQTNTFLLNTFCAGAFLVFLLLGIHFLCFKRSRISRQNFRVLSGVLLIALSFHTLFIDYETQLDSAISANNLRMVIVLLSFVAVMINVTYMLYSTKGSKGEELESNDIEEEPATSTVEQPKASVAEQPQQNLVPQSSQNVEQPFLVPTEKPNEPSGQPTEVVTEQVIRPSEQPTKQPTEQPAAQPDEVVAEQPEEVVAEQTVEQPSVQETTEPATQDEDVEPENKDANETVPTAETQLVASEEEHEEEEVKESHHIDNASIDDLIFFQKVEALMASKRLFCEQDINREQIAFAVGTNRTYLARSIKNATGKTFLEYITDLRTSYAATLLTTTNEPLDVIGTIAGFGSKSAYYRAFSAAYGCSPSEYRKR